MLLDVSLASVLDMYIEILCHNNWNGYKYAITAIYIARLCCIATQRAINTNTAQSGPVIFTNHYMYADNSCIIEPSPSGLQNLLNIWKDFSEETSIIIYNDNKSKYMCVKGPVTLSRRPLVTTCDRKYFPITCDRLQPSATMAAKQILQSHWIWSATGCWQKSFKTVGRQW